MRSAIDPTRAQRRIVGLGTLALLIAGCGSGSSTAGYTTTTHAISGTIAGLSGSGLVLEDNNGDDLTVAAAATSFTFAAASTSGATYSVTIKAQPRLPLQKCSVTNATGTVGRAAAVNVQVSCKTWTPKFSYLANRGDLVNTSGTPVVPIYTYQNSSVGAYSVGPGSGAAAAELTMLAGSPFSSGSGSNAGSGTEAADPLGRFVFVADAGSGDISAFTVDSASGALSAVSGSPFSTTESPQSLVVDPTGKFLIVATSPAASASTSGGSWAHVSVYTIDQTTGALAAIGSPYKIEVPLDANSVTHAGGINPAVAIDPSGKFVFVSLTGLSELSGLGCGGITFPGRLFAFRFDSPNGLLTEISGSPYKTADSPIAVAVDPNGDFVYVASGLFSGGGCGFGSLSITAFSYNSSNGALTQINGSPFGSPFRTSGSNTAISIDPAGKFAYVADGQGVDTYAIDATTGALGLTGAAVTLDGPGTSVLVDPSGKYAYVTAESSLSSTQSGQSGQLLGFSIDPSTGALTALSSNPVAAGVVPNDIVVTGDFE